MKHSLPIFPLLLSIAASAFASDPVPEIPRELTPELIRSAMNDAEKEYEQTLKSRSEEAKRNPKAKTGDLRVSLPAARLNSENKDLLEDLARQVDLLKTKVVVEKSTLLATQSPRTVRVRGARTVFNYLPESIYEITCAVEHVTDIQLKVGEALTTPPLAGDTTRWHLGLMKSGLNSTEATHIVVKPLEEDIETNLIITTTERTYQLRLKSSDFHMPSVSWNYPEDTAKAFETALKKETSEEPTTPPDQLHFEYEIDGPGVSWRPLRVFDDGRKTFIQMPDSMRVTESPALFVLEEGEEPLLVNYRMKGTFYIVDRLFEAAELRVGPETRVKVAHASSKSFWDRLF